MAPMAPAAPLPPTATPATPFTAPFAAATTHPTLAAGDPRAEAVVAEFDLLGAPAREALGKGVRHGLASLGPRPPDAVAALLEHLETPPPRVDPLAPHRGDVVSLSVPPLWYGLCATTAALAYTYASPAAAARLRTTGRRLPADHPAAARTRLVDSTVWARHTIRPGGLLRGGPGYLATVEARLQRARAGHTQADLARTWLGCTRVAFLALEAVGIEIEPEEEHLLYQHWSYAAHLLGLHEDLYGDIVDHAGADRLRALLDATTPAPDATSRALTTSMIEAQAEAMAGVPGAVLSADQLRALVHSVLRRTFGEERADLMGVPAPAVTDLMPLIGRLNREARHWQTFTPASAREARRRALDGPAPELIAAVLPAA